MNNLPAFNNLSWTYRTADCGPYGPGSNVIWYQEAHEIVAPSLITFRIVLSGGVALRYIRIRFYIEAFSIYFASDPTPISGAETWLVSAGTGLPYTHVAAAVNLITLPMPDNIFLSGGDDIRTFIDNLDAGDQIDQVRYHYRCWLGAN